MHDRLAGHVGFESELAEELAYTRLLQSISLQLVADQPVEALYECLAAAATTLLRSDFATMQMLYPERNGGELRLIAHRGFSDDAVACWTWVAAGTASSCGAAMRARQRVIIPDVERCDFLAGTDNLVAYRREGIRAAQSTPLFSREGRVVGMLSTHWREVHSPPPRQFILFDILARQAADLIERRRAGERLHEAYGALEHKVKVRTGEVRDLLRRLVNSQEEERRRVAREIHDQMGQQMTALRINIELLAAAPSDAQAELTLTLAETLDRSIDFVAWELRPGALDQLGLAAALQSLVAEWSTRFGIAAECHVSPVNGIRFDRDVESNVYRLVQEALHNVYKHAAATHADVRAKRREDHVVFEVSDDGCGFVHDDPARDTTAHLGLVGMRERAALIGGELDIKSAPGQGATVCLKVPLP